MRVFNMGFKIAVIVDLVFPKAALPNIALSLRHS